MSDWAPHGSPPTSHDPRPAADGGRLLRVLGLGFGIAVAVGGTVGMGILRTPGEVARQLPNLWLFLAVWIAGGLYAVLAAASVAEVAAATPRSGGFYVIARRAFGPHVGFMTGLSDWFGLCGTLAGLALVIGEYTTLLVPAAETWRRGIALAVIVGFSLLQWRGIRWGSRTQIATCVLKGLAFAVLIVACLAVGDFPREPAAPSATEPTGSWAWLIPLTLSLQSVMYTYAGWEYPLYFGDEIRDPGRELPRSMIGGALATIVFYVLVILALLAVLAPAQMAGAKLAAGAAAGAVFGPRGETVLGALVIASLLSAVNANVLSAPRVLATLSRDGFLAKLGAVNLQGTPAPALVLSTLVAGAFAISGQNAVDKLIGVMSFFFVLNYTIAIAAVFAVRHREPETQRPYRAWGYPWTTALALAGSFAFLASAVAADILGKTTYSLQALLLLAICFPVVVASIKLASK